MARRLAKALSPYLRSHADNPVDWYEWGEEAFAVAVARNVPVLVSIGYSSCHWCHVMARESFSDPAVAAVLNDQFVCIKVDREEHPEVDESYMAAAGAFTQQLGWPLNVFTTPDAQVFYASTYSPPEPIPGRASFSQLLEGVLEAWHDRSDQVMASASELASALAELWSSARLTASAPVLDELFFAAALDRLRASEDPVHGGFGTQPKFPMAPVIDFLLDVDEPLAVRTLRTIAASPLHDHVGGGFFRYSTRTNWDVPHYEKMLYDNAQLLGHYATVAAREPSATWAVQAATGIVRFFGEHLARTEGGFGSAQDSESIINGARNEGGYYLVSADERARLAPPAVDNKVISGLNGMAIAALARAGNNLQEPEWISFAAHHADAIIARHWQDRDALVRLSVDGAVSTASATFDDYGFLASGLLELALATGESRYAGVARNLLERVMASGAQVPGGGDPVLAARSLTPSAFAAEGSFPNGISAHADALRLAYEITLDERYLSGAHKLLAPYLAQAAQNPLAHAGTLAAASRLFERAPVLLIVGDEDRSLLSRTARELSAGRILVVSVSVDQARSFEREGCELFAAKSPDRSGATAYLCRGSVCSLPVTTADALERLIESAHAHRATPAGPLAQKTQLDQNAQPIQDTQRD